MSDDDPFAEPNDTERTVIRPNPGGRRPGVAAPGKDDATTDSAASGPRPAPREDAPARRDAPASPELGMTGMNKLNASASTLFSLVSRIRNRAQHLDPERCPAHAGDDLARWGIRGPHGNAPIYAMEHLQPCAAPEILDWPAVSAMVTARRLHRLRVRHGRRTAADRSHAWRHGIDCRCGEWRALAEKVR